MSKKRRKKTYTGRDEGIRRSKLAPGAPGSDKAGVGVITDEKKEANRDAARDLLAEWEFEYYG